MSNTESTPQEIERKFLIPESQVPTDLSSYVGRVINQGYLSIDPLGSEVRLRDNEGDYTQTVKTDGELVRGEWEAPITKEQFETFWPATSGRRVEKTRYKIPYGEHTIELDLFDGSLKGLVMAEVEFTDTDSAHNFTQPDWFGQEVTKNKSYKNKNLAINGLPK